VLLVAIAAMGAAMVISITLLPFFQWYGFFGVGNHWAWLKVASLSDYLADWEGWLVIATAVGATLTTVVALLAAADRRRVGQVRHVALATAGCAYAALVAWWREDPRFFFKYIGVGGVLTLLIPLGLAISARQLRTTAGTERQPG